MLRAGLFSGCFAILALGGPALAEQHPGSGGISFKPLVRTQSMAPPAAPTPYPMTYSEQVAQRLGVRDGGLDLAGPPDRSNPYAPSISFTGSMLRLQWRP